MTTMLNFLMVVAVVVIGLMTLITLVVEMTNFQNIKEKQDNHVIKRPLRIFKTLKIKENNDLMTYFDKNIPGPHKHQLIPYRKGTGIFVKETNEVSEVLLIGKLKMTQQILITDLINKNLNDIGDDFENWLSFIYIV